MFPDIFKMFILNQEIHSRVTRQSGHYHIPLCRTSFSQRTIKFQGSVIWNRLLSSIDVNCSIGICKKRVKLYIIENPM